MSHTDRVREAERAILERAFVEADEHGGCGCILCELVAEERVLRAATCATCKGEGEVESGAWECPAKCDHGRKRD